MRVARRGQLSELEGGSTTKLAIVSTEKTRGDVLERVPTRHLAQREPPPAPKSWIDRLSQLFHEHKGAARTAMMGASALGGVVGAPLVAHAQEAATPPPTATPEPSREALDLAARELFGITRTSDVTPDLRRLETTLPDGRTINLFPTQAELLRWASTGALDAPGPTTVMARDRPLDRLLTGVASSVREEPWRADFHDYFRARAAVSEVPTALAGMALQPVADGLYEVVDHIPPAIRRPFDRSVGILLDNAVSLPANALTSMIPMTGGAPPSAHALDMPAYPQMRNSCGETMVATWLKAHGVPVALGETDTQTSFFEGTNLLMDADLRRRGLSLISGPGSMRDLETYVAHGYPVMVSVGWPNGGGHYAVVTGYDRDAQTVTINGYRADGEVATVPYSEFQADWGRHANLMTVAHPQRDARLAQLREAGRLSREARIQDGLSISDIWVNQRLELFVEAAYRYRGTNDDLTIRLNVMSSESEHSVGDMFGGSVRYRHRFEGGTELEFYAERVAVKGPADSVDVEAVLRNTAVYVGARHGPFAGRAGYERGSFQAAFQAELTRRLMSVGAEARVSVGPDGHYNVFIGAAGTF